jgi:hypothetical protein
LRAKRAKWEPISKMYAYYVIQSRKTGTPLEEGIKDGVERKSSPYHKGPSQLYNKNLKELHLESTVS